MARGQVGAYARRSTGTRGGGRTITIRSARTATTGARTTARRTGRALRTLAAGRRVRARIVVVDGPPTPAAPAPADTEAPPRSVPVAAPARVPLPVDHRRRPLTVLVPVHDAFDDLRRCLDSVVRNTSHPVTLLVVDDASTDPRVGPWLAELAATHRDVVVETNEENLGFVGTVNRGFALRPDDDVVLLNSDTEVPPRWIESLLAAAADPTVATVTALSNNAGAFSAPEQGRHNDLPADVDRVGRAVAQRSLRARPEVHTGNGFCMLVKREVIDELEGFDETRFGRGYCEENDFCMRARAAGWRNVVDDALLVAHHGSASFGEDKAALLAQNRRVLDELHPEYNELVRAFLDDERMAQARERVRLAFDGAARARPRVLYVLHGGTGGTPQTNADLMAAVADHVDPLLLRSDGTELVLSHGVDGDEIERVALPAEIGTATFTDPAYAAAARRILVEQAVELVHVRHLHGHGHDLPAAACELGIPLVVSLHDYHLVCPSLQLLDDHDRFCAGRCTPGQGTCRTPPGLDDTPHLKHGFVHEWRRRSTALLERADACVTTSDAAADVLVSALPVLRDRLHVIEHGRDLTQAPSVASRPGAGERARILVPGVLGVHKGAKLLEAIGELDTDERLEFHLIGSLTREARIPRLVDHGRYERDEFAELAARIRPAATAVLSIWAETYSHTVTESWSVGVPVLGSPLGAVGERIGRHGGGWTVDVTDPARALARILEVIDDADEWEARRDEATVAGLPTVADMAERYVELYERVMSSRRTLVAT